MDIVKDILDGEEVIITSFSETLNAHHPFKGLLMGQIIECNEPIIPPCAKRRRKSSLTYICYLVDAEAQVTDLKFRIVILGEGAYNITLNEKDIFFTRNPRVLGSNSIPGVLSFVVNFSDITLVEQIRTLNEESHQHQEGGSPSRNVGVARRRIRQPNRSDPNLRNLISLENVLSISPMFYSSGTFTDESIIEILSDEICLGYCKLCNKNCYYSEFIWRTLEDEKNPLSDLPYCPECDEDELTTPLIVFFNCPLKFEIEGSDEIDVLFYSRVGDNILGIMPINYARDNTVRGTFRFKAAKLLNGSVRIGYDFILIGEVHIVHLVSVEPVVQSETTYQITD